MSEYFIVVRRKKVGPFSVENLPLHELKPTTLVWREGMPEWTEAQNVSELAETLEKAPPVVPNRPLIAAQRMLWIGGIYLAILVFSGVAGLIIGYAYYENQGGPGHDMMLTEWSQSYWQHLEFVYHPSHPFYEQSRRSHELANSRVSDTEAISHSMGWWRPSEIPFTKESVDAAKEFHRQKFNEILERSVITGGVVFALSMIVLIGFRIRTAR
jgi:hypothetical protein